MEILAYRCRTYVAIYMHGDCVVFTNNCGQTGSTYFPEAQPNVHLTCTCANTRWERMTRSDAKPWISKASDYIKKQKKEKIA